MMSIKCLISARSCRNLLHLLPNQTNFSIVHAGSTSILAQSVSHARTASTASASDSTEWTTIYRLPLIRLAAGFQRLKIYQGVLTTLALPLSIGLSELNYIPPNAVEVVGAIGGSGLLTLSLCSLIIRNVVGLIYINGECNKLKMAYVNYWGKRCEAVVDIDDLDVDWAKVRPTVLNLYQKIRLYSNKERSFKLMLNYGVIVEPETFAGIFGE